MPRLALFVALLLVLAGAPRWAPAQEAGDPGDPVDQYQADFKRKNLGRYLGIDQQKVEQLIRIEQKYRVLKLQTETAAKNSLQQFKQVMSQPQPPEQEVQRILNHMFLKRQEKLALEQRQFEEQKTILTSPVQQGRYLMFLMSLHHQIAKEAQKVRTGPPAGMAPPAGPGPREIPVVGPGR